VDETKADEVSLDMISKVKDIVVPFVALEIFKWLDRDGDHGVSKDELMFVCNLAMESGGSPESVVKTFAWSVLDKDKNGKISTGEVANFVKDVFLIVAKTAQCVVDTFSSAFRGDAVQLVAQQAIQNLDSNDDGVIDESDDVWEMVKSGIAEMNSSLAEIKDNQEGLSELQQNLFSEVKAVNEFAMQEAEGGVDLTKFMKFNRKLMEARIQFAKTMLDSDEVSDMIPPPIFAKIQDWFPIVEMALMKATDDNLESVSKCAFTLLDANGNGRLEKEEILGFAGLMNPERSVDEKFDALLALVDTDNDRKITREELLAFASKAFDLASCSASAGIDIYAEVCISLVSLVLDHGFQKIIGGNELTEAKFESIMESIQEDGPEVLLGPLMEDEDN